MQDREQMTLYHRLRELATNGRQFTPNEIKILQKWFIFSVRAARDKLLNIKFSDRCRSVPSRVLYRDIIVPIDSLKKLLNGKAIRQKTSLTSSWAAGTPKVSYEPNFRRPGFVMITIRKRLIPEDVVVYEPSLSYPSPDIGFSRTSSEREVVIRNTDYWRQINPSDLYLINGELVKSCAARYKK